MKKRLAEWPETFETVILSNLQPRPDDAPEEPASVVGLCKTLNAGGWETRVGYARAWRRGQKTGTFRVMESFGVFAGSHPESAYRVVAIYWRFADKTETHAWFADTGEIEMVEKPSGAPGTWTWQDARIVSGIKSHRVKVSDVKEFAAVRGSVLPGWFKAIADRFAEQAAKQLCGKAEAHEPHVWHTVNDIVKSCSGKATKPKETEGT